MKRSASVDDPGLSRKRSIVSSLQNGDVAADQDEDGRASKRIRISSAKDQQHLSDGDVPSGQGSDSILPVDKDKENENQNKIVPVKKRRGGRPRKVVNAEPAAQGLSPATNKSDKSKRPPGRPRVAKPPLVRQDSDRPSGVRLPGRQRVPHPDAKVEALLVRQAELKRLYKATVTALKPAVVVLADRSLQELKNDEKAHTNYPQHDKILKGLDDALARRRQALDREAQLERKRIEEDYQAQRAILLRDFHRKVKDRQDDLLLRAQDDYISVVRGSRFEEDDEATEEEEDNMLTEKQRYMLRSRSAFFIDTAKAWSHLETQNGMRQRLLEIAPEIANAKIEGFATYDRDIRLKGIVERNLANLVRAGEKIEKAQKPKPPIIRNEEAIQLQLLAQTIDDQIHGIQQQSRLVNAPQLTFASNNRSILPSPQMQQFRQPEFHAQRIRPRLPEYRPEDYAPDGTLQVRPVGAKGPNPVFSPERPDAAQTVRWNAPVGNSTDQNSVYRRDFHPASGSDEALQGHRYHNSLPSPGSFTAHDSARHFSAPPLPGPTQARYSPEPDSKSKDTGRKAHGPTPAYMQNSGGSFGRFPIETSKKAANARPLAAKPNSKSDKGKREFTGGGIMLSPTSGPNVYHLGETQQSDLPRDDPYKSRKNSVSFEHASSKPMKREVSDTPGPLDRPAPLSYNMDQSTPKLASHTPQNMSPQAYQGPYGPSTPTQPGPSSRRSSLQGPERIPAMRPPPDIRHQPVLGAQPSLPSINTAIPYYASPYSDSRQPPPASPRNMGLESYASSRSAGAPQHPPPQFPPLSFPSGAPNNYSTPSSYAKQFPPPPLPRAPPPYDNRYPQYPLRSPTYPLPPPAHGPPPPLGPYSNHPSYSRDAPPPYPPPYPQHAGIGRDEHRYPPLPPSALVAPPPPSSSHGPPRPSGTRTPPLPFTRFRSYVPPDQSPPAAPPPPPPHHGVGPPLPAQYVPRPS